MKYRSVVAIAGRQGIVDTFKICGLEMIITGKFYRTVRVKEEWDANVEDPKAVIRDLKSQGVCADVFTFAQRLPHTTPAFKYRTDFDNVAAVSISTYEEWWKNVNHRVRTKNRKSIKNGVVVRPIAFDDELVKGITQIYNETPIIQGRASWNYGLSFEETKKANADFPGRADFLGAYFGDELIAFMKLLYTPPVCPRNRAPGQNCVPGQGPPKCLDRESCRNVCGKKDPLSAVRKVRLRN